MHNLENIYNTFKTRLVSDINVVYTNSYPKIVKGCNFDGVYDLKNLLSTDNIKKLKKEIKPLFYGFKDIPVSKLLTLGLQNELRLSHIKDVGIFRDIIESNEEFSDANRHTTRYSYNCAHIAFAPFLLLAYFLSREKEIIDYFFKKDTIASRLTSWDIKDISLGTYHNIFKKCNSADNQVNYIKSNFHLETLAYVYNKKLAEGAVIYKSKFKISGFFFEKSSSYYNNCNVDAYVYPAKLDSVFNYIKDSIKIGKTKSSLDTVMNSKKFKEQIRKDKDE